MRIKADKYEFIFDEQTGSLKIHRHGMPWRTDTGDGALLALMQHCEDQAACMQRVRRPLEKLKSRVSGDLYLGEREELSLVSEALGLLPERKP